LIICFVCKSLYLWPLFTFVSFSLFFNVFISQILLILLFLNSVKLFCCLETNEEETIFHNLSLEARDYPNLQKAKTSITMPFSYSVFLGVKEKENLITIIIRLEKLLMFLNMICIKIKIKVLKLILSKNLFYWF